jgi:hypothetical protein
VIRKELNTFRIFRLKEFFKKYSTYNNKYKKLTKKLRLSGFKTGTNKYIKYKNILLLRLGNFFKKQFKKAKNIIKYTTINRKLIKFSNSSVNKYLTYNNLKNFNFFFLRKNKIFNKSRYSRNRQIYRTGFYLCLWLNIIIVYLLFFIFYRFTFNFGYLW